MPQTTNSSSVPYCSAPQFFTFYAYQLCADMLRAQPEAPRPSQLAMLDPTNPAGQKLLSFLQLGAGEIEAACSVSARYSPADLNALGGVSQVTLQRLNAARTMWAIYQRLKPGTARPDEIPFAVESEKLLENLRNGERVFSFVETQQAGLPSVNPPDPTLLITGNIVGRASRLFPGYGNTGLNSGRGWGQGSDN